MAQKEVVIHRVTTCTGSPFAVAAVQNPGAVDLHWSYNTTDLTLVV
jgi:hypothetical protein